MGCVQNAQTQEAHSSFSHPQKQFKKRKKHKRHFRALLSQMAWPISKNWASSKTIQKKKETQASFSRPCHRGPGRYQRTGHPQKNNSKRKETHPSFSRPYHRGPGHYQRTVHPARAFNSFVSCLSFHHSRLSTTTPVKKKLIKYQKTGYLVLVAHAKSSGEDV